MRQRLTKLWVVPEFKKRLHIEAITAGMTMKRYQEYVINQNLMIKDMFKKRGGKQIVI